MLIWDTVEVGRNDGANLVNGVIGARILTRQWAIPLAGICVLVGAIFSSDVIDTARKGIFNPPMLTLEQLLAVYASVYIVDTILLYSYSAFGMPVSTTASLVFALLGGSFAMGSFRVVNWTKSGNVVLAIIFSIFLTGVAAFLIQRAVRAAIRDRSTSLTTLLLHGGWVGGGVLAGLLYFMLLKGMKSLGFVRYLNSTILERYGTVAVIMVVWACSAILIHVVLILFRRKAARLLFPVLTVLGMMCMAFAFGQNDLANCASPGLSTFYLVKNADKGVAGATSVDIHRGWLFLCGLLMAAGMFTRNAQRVTQAAVRTGSMGHHVKLWAPNWCIALAGAVLKLRGPSPALAPQPTRTPRGKLTHYDPVRACVIMSVAASVIATASSRGLPVSTTYVAFAAIVATGMADRIFQRGDAALKLGRAIWVVFCWFAAAVIAAVVTAFTCRCIYHLGIWGMGLCLAASLTVRQILKRSADRQEERVRREAEERMHPEDFALEAE